MGSASGRCSSAEPASTSSSSDPAGTSKRLIDSRLDSSGKGSSRQMLGVQVAAPSQRRQPARHPWTTSGASSPSVARRGVDLRIFIAPEHAHRLEIIAAIGEWASLENAKRALVELLAE